jgi:lysophospholipase L1-like esterase
MVSSALLNARLPSRSYRLGVIGTSLIQQNDVGANGKVSHWARGWLSWARVLSRGIFTTPIWYDPVSKPGWEPSGTPGAARFFNGLNAGVSGQMIKDIEARKYFLVNDVDVDIVVLDGGANDMGSQTKEYIQSYREALADFYLQNGKLVILLPILARNTTSWTAGGAERKKAAWINARTREFTKTRDGCFYFDWNKAWVDSMSANGTPLTGYSPDGIHFSPQGGYAVGLAFAQFLATILPEAQPRVTSQDDQFDATENPLGNLFTNPFCLGTGGSIGTGVTGTVAPGLRLERSAGASTGVASKETRPGNRGEYQVLTLSPSGTGENLFYIRSNAADTPHTYAEGTWIQASIEVDVSAYTGWTGISLFLQDRGTNGLISYAMEPFDGGSGNEKLTGSAWSGLLVTPPIEIVAGSANLRWRLEVRFDGAVAGTPVVKAGAVEVRQVSNPKTLMGFDY